MSKWIHICGKSKIEQTAMLKLQVPTAILQKHVARKRQR